MAIENAVLAGAALLAMAAAIWWMIRVNHSEKRRAHLIAQRYQEWIEGGSVPEEKPNFFPDY